MKYLLENLKEVKETLKEKKNIGLFLDFDGTLAPIAKTPEEAYLPLKAKKLLISLNKKPQISLAIISGRKLENIINKINIDGIIYAGNHGLEWEIGGKEISAVIEEKILRTLFCIKNKMQELEKKFKGVFIEDKGLTIGVHYRLLAGEAANFKKNFFQIINPYLFNHELTVIKGKKVFDIRPNINWTKGHILKFLIDQISKKQGSEIIPIYIGDDKTDEDAFYHLKKEITIKVGKSFNSQAKYFLKNNKEVIEFLEWLNNRKM